MHTSRVKRRSFQTRQEVYAKHWGIGFKKHIFGKNMEKAPKLDARSRATYRVTEKSLAKEQMNQ